jgi:5-methyltetrahydrofolate--homocysteine methyltransferase
MNSILQGIHDSVVVGKKEEVELKVQQALEQRQPPLEILNEGLIAAMREVGRRFECGDLFVPEMLIAARAMQGQTEIQ